MVENWCPVDGIVLDWFMGSGTTAVAAKMTGRQWIGCEIDHSMAGKARERVGKTPVPLFTLQPEQIAMEAFNEATTAD
jgi:site-specific DNA-methyltransferase (adenine-specific)